MLHRTIGLLALGLSLTACGGSDPAAPDAATSTIDASGVRPVVFGGVRPAELQIPDNFDETQTYPLVVVLHGFGANGFAQFNYFGFQNVLTAGQAFVIAPDGLTNSSGQQYWNADPECCDFDNANPDDVGYIGGLIDDIKAAWPIDAGAVFIVGHSNGGYMAYRMACERADAIAAVVSLAGAGPSVPASCTPSQPVATLQVHGTADAIVPYSAGEGSVEFWRDLQACTGFAADLVQVDYDSAVLGNETTRFTGESCVAGGTVARWDMSASSHIPTLRQPDYVDATLSWLLSNRR